MSGRDGSDWTDERKAQVTELWAQGYTCSQIARAMGGVSRSAIMGKVSRLGLATRHGKTGARKAEASHKKAEALVPKPAPKSEPPKPEPSDPVKLVDLAFHHCRFPLWGDAGAPDFPHCGRKRDGASVYCGHHRRVVFQGKKVAA